MIKSLVNAEAKNEAGHSRKNQAAKSKLGEIKDNWKDAMQFEWDRDKEKRNIKNTEFPLTKQSLCFMILCRLLLVIPIIPSVSIDLSLLASHLTDVY